MLLLNNSNSFVLLYDGICQPVECLEGIFVRETLDHDRFDDLDFDMGEHFYNRFGCLTSPAVGSDDRCKPHSWV